MQLRFSTYPRTQTPEEFLESVINVFNGHFDEIGTERRKKGLTSDQVLAVIREDLVNIGFDVESGKREQDKIKRPVFYGENAQPDLQYEIDAWHQEWSAGLEVEAGRAWKGNAIYRDLIQALVMVELSHLILAVPLAYRYNSGGRPMVSNDYENTISVAQALYGHSRIDIPFSLSVIGY